MNPHQNSQSALVDDWSRVNQLIVKKSKNSILFVMSKQFDELSNFILNEMRMSHIYQPVMLIELLGKKGSASTTEIAKALLGHDVSQVEYYQHITKNMVGKVLTQSRGITSKDKNQYSLYGDDVSAVSHSLTARH